jgi:hypothetical protein
VLSFNALCLENRTFRKMPLQNATRRGEDSQMICPPATDDLRPIAVARTYAELVAAVCQRIEQLGTTYEAVNDLTGLPDRYLAKILCPAQVKHFGPMSLTCTLQALGLVLVLASDDAQLGRIHARLPQRRQGRRPQSPAVVAASHSGAAPPAPEMPPVAAAESRAGS